MYTTPVEIRRVEDRELHITWADRHQSILPNAYLGQNCAGAACVTELTGERMLNARAVPADNRGVEISLVGRYAVQIRWSDGHSTGIYPFERLRALCPCDACQRR